jgi:hypothetical protein
MQVDPANRLVADSLEADWNGRLRALAAAQEEYQRQRTADRVASTRSTASASSPSSTSGIGHSASLAVALSSELPWPVCRP